jgi:hypothetical protein|tara:strand:+ start:1990 stop:2994 length:1005 start_codon:yes stop_codon:yes gene_type:complete
MKNYKNVILCGPWIGEFSYEVLGWAPKLRYYITNYYSDYHVVHFGYPGRSLLYRDFVDEYVGYDTDIVDNILPSNSGGVGRGVDHILKYKLTEDFMNSWIESNKNNFDGVYNLRPVDLNCIRKDQVEVNMPDTKFIHFNADTEVEIKIVKFLKGFSEGKDVISIMAPTPHEMIAYRENWNPKHWIEFIENVIVELKLNVIMMGITSKNNLQGSYTFEDSYLYSKYPNNIRSYVLSSGIENSLDYQVSILKNTLCSVWGSTGACQLSYYCGRPMFSQLVLSTSLKRQFLESQKNITNNFKHIKYFQKYNSGMDFYNSPANEFYEEFKQFYLEIKK